MPAILNPRAARKRSQTSARKAGADHERKIADWLAAMVDDRIDRRVKTGAKDRGDIGGVRCHGQRVVIEAKNTSTLSVGPHLREAEVERGNDDALAGLVVYKRHGIAAPGDQVVVMTLRDFVALLTGSRPLDGES